MKKAIVLGGTHDHIKLIEILRNREFHVTLIDYLDNPPARLYSDKFIQESTLDVNAVANIAAIVKPNILITTCIDQALLTMAYVCDKLRLPCHIDYQTTLELTNKEYMKRKLCQNQIPTSSYIAQKISDPAETVDLKFPLVVKPVDSNSSKGIIKVQNNEQLENARKFAFSKSRVKTIIIEEFLKGEEFSVDVAVKNGEPKILMVTRNNKVQSNKDYFTINQSDYPATNDVDLLKNIENIVKKIVVAYKIHDSPLLVQLIHYKGDLNVIEFSARLGGGSKHHMIKRITGFDVLEWFVDLILSKSGKIQVRQNYKFACMKYIYGKNGKIANFMGFDGLKKEGIIDDFFLYKNQGMEISNHIASSDRAAGLFVTDNDYNSLKRRLRIANEQIDILDYSGNSILLNTFL